MEQRALRLGDLVDDYCPRERRITDHVIVAMVDDGIRRTRCAACEAEHEYKEARMPRKKMKTDEAPGLTGGVLVVPKPAVANGQATDAASEAEARAAASQPPPANHESQPPDAPAASAAQQDGDLDPMPDAFIGHRPLIRATLPRTENDVPVPRAIPEFTMHQRPGRGFGGRGFRPHGFSGGNGAPPRDGNGPDGNRAPGPGGPGGKSRHRRRHRRPR